MFCDFLFYCQRFVSSFFVEHLTKETCLKLTYFAVKTNKDNKSQTINLIFYQT